MGPNRKTAITFDLLLYIRVKKLQMSRKDLDNIIVRPGELHIIKAMLATIGGFIDGSGLDLCWNEADIGDCTTRKIHEGGHIRRGQNAHMVTLQSMLSLYSEEFILYKSLADLAGEVNEACRAGDPGRHGRNCLQKSKIWMSMAK